MCDHACVFLGDCCYDYLLECDLHSRYISAALQEQYSVFHHFDQYSTYVTLRMNDNRLDTMKMIDSCPHSSRRRTAIESMCSEQTGTSTMSGCIPVKHNGVMYRNKYCAACHGIPLHQLHHVALYSLECDLPNIHRSDVHLQPFLTDIDCMKCRFTATPNFSE